MGISGGLSQAPMFAAASTLDPMRATTGSAVLNMSRQVGSAVGVALLIALTATNTSTIGSTEPGGYRPSPGSPPRPRCLSHGPASADLTETTP
jgi:hypothetical protein